MVSIPVNGAVLRWGRQFRNLSEEAAATMLGISEEDLRAFEDGERLPTLTMFEKFAKKYQLPKSTLFRSTPPETPPLPADFRTIENDAHTMSYELSVAISRVRNFLFELRRLSDDDDEFKGPDVPQYDKDSIGPEALAENERSRLEVAIESQFRWSSAYDAFLHWRGLIESTGISVFLQRFPLSDCRGFSLFDDSCTPCIVVNKSEEADVARSFTLWHEYCHLIIRKPGVSDQDDRNPVEQYCNRFAGAFLMPREAIEVLLGDWPRAPVEWPDEHMRAWARRAKVSQIALAIRLEHLRLAPSGFARRFHRPPVPKRRKTGDVKIPPATLKFSEYGLRYSSAVMDAYDRGAIDQVQAVEALNMKSQHFGKFREAISNRRAKLIE